MRRINPKSSKVTNSLDNATGAKEILLLWKSKYDKLFNSVDKNNKHEGLFQRIDYPDFITLDNVAQCINRIPCGKAAGTDGVPGEVLRISSQRLRIHLSILINACFKHCHLLPLSMRTILIPLIKNKLKPATYSNNYRLIAISTAFSKLVEHILLSKIHAQLYTTDNQFGFKNEHGTEMCIFLLKDIINYYNSSHSPVFCCFLDARKAFDRVNHAILFKKMLDRSIPIWLVQFIAAWYIQ